jgi:hypothetical protein
LKHSYLYHNNSNYNDNGDNSKNSDKNDNYNNDDSYHDVNNNHCIIIEFKRAIPFDVDRLKL